MKALKIAVVGGGSTYTPELIDGFVRYYDELPIREICLQDIDAERLDVVGGLAQRMVAEQGIPVTLTTERAEALDGANFVLTQLRVGGMAARALDERIPLKHGVLGQETTGPGGFAKALRTVPVMLEIARDIERYAPGAWLINFTNPSGLVTQALLNYSNVRAIGLCNVPINMQRHIAQALDVEPERVELDYVGLNHLSWVRHVYLDGEDVTARVLANAAVLDAYPVDADLLGKMGMLLNYYLLYYYHTDRALAKQQSAERTRAEYLQEIEAELLEMYRDPSLKEKPALLEKRGGAHYSTAAVELIRAIAQDRREVHIVNVRNNGALPDLPPQSVVEVPATVGATGAKPLTCGRVPPMIRGLLTAVDAYEELTIQAAVTGDEDLAQLALLSHPLVPSWDVAKALWQDLKAAHRPYLPQFA